MNSWPVRHVIAAGGVVLAVAIGALTLVFGTPGAILGVLCAAAAGIFLSRRLGGYVDRFVNDLLRMGPGGGGHRPQLGGTEETDRLARAAIRLENRFAVLLESESIERRRVESILGSMQQGVIVVNSGGAVESANPAAIETFGGTHHWRPGIQLASITREHRVNALVGKATDGGEARRDRIQLRDQNRVVDVFAAPIPPAESGAKRALLLVNDVTDMVRAENTRREFVSNASHELRTPIAAIQAAAEALQQGALADSEIAEDFLRRILEDVARMDELVAEMLELLRLETGQTPLHLGPLDLVMLVNDTADRFRPMAIGNGIELACKVIEDVPLVNADYSKIEVVLGNLLSNSLRSTQSGGSIQIGVSRTNGHVALTVTDTGSGISSEHLPHIFERFYKADPSRQDGGTGLGLAISKHIVQAHDGVIEAESSPGQRTTIRFTLLAIGDAS
jgi:two-component system phosphate regulon sensor histidine kinase PhoR